MEMHKRNRIIILSVKKKMTKPGTGNYYSFMTGSRCPSHVPEMGAHKIWAYVIGHV